MLVSLLTPSAIDSAASLHLTLSAESPHFSAKMFVANSLSAFESLKLVNRSPMPCSRHNRSSVITDLAVSEI
jgi:hypothetical protein